VEVDVAVPVLLAWHQVRRVGEPAGEEQLEVGRCDKTALVEVSYEAVKRIYQRNHQLHVTSDRVAAGVHYVEMEPLAPQRRGIGWSRWVVIEKVGTAPRDDECRHTKVDVFYGSPDREFPLKIAGVVVTDWVKIEQHVVEVE